MKRTILSLEELLEDFKELLKDNSLKYTKQRERVFRVLYDSECHLSPEELYEKVKKTTPKLKTGIATVYRTLNLLEESRVVNSITFGASGKKYELGNKPHHDHMICDSCEKIIEFEDQEIEDRQIKIAQEYDFKIQSHIMQLHGICKECQK